jgi:hypothetical protein
MRATRLIGAAALLVVGGVHLQQYTVDHFSVIPTIGPLFLANFVAATTAALLLLIAVAPPLRRIRPLLDVVAASGGVGAAGGALAGLLISEQTTLFGFMEYGYRLAIVVAIAAEVVAIASLGLFLTRLRRVRKEVSPCGPGAGAPGVARGQSRPSGARTA